MRTKLKYSRELSRSIDAEAQLSKCMEDTYHYLMQKYPSFERTTKIQSGSVATDFWDFAQGSNLFCSTQAVPLDIILHITEPFDMRFHVGVEYEVTHEFNFLPREGRVARQVNRFLHLPRSYEHGRRITEHYDRHERLVKIRKEANVQNLNFAYISGPILVYLKMLK